MENKEMKKRLYFEKKPYMHLVGHLDLMRIFQRAMNRANVPISYSKGFNPHQKMSFALPLPVGYLGENEIVEIILENDMDNLAICTAVNKALPMGVEVVRVEDISIGSKPAASQLIKAFYEVKLPSHFKKLHKYILPMMEEDTLLFTKQTKKGVKEEDAKKSIFLLEGDEKSIQMEIATGSKQNLRPEVVLNLLADRGQMENRNWDSCQFTRKYLVLG